MNRNIHVLLKPASSECNMRCKYCFYCDVSAHRENKSFGIMQEEIVDAVIKKTLAYAKGGSVTYAFQGGEPLMAGERFFRNFSEKVCTYNTMQTRVNYCLQTNGTLLTDSLCGYLKEQHYLVGISLDGPRNLHDANRTFANGTGSFDSVRQGIALLRKYDIPFNILTVLTHRTVEYIDRLRVFFENCGFDDLQFITCLEPLGTAPFSAEFVMSPADYFSVNRVLFDWYLERNRSGKRLSIRHFDNMMRMLDGQRPELCGTLGYCPGQLVIEGNGNCYPCDFYCDDAHLLGNIRDQSPEEMSSGTAMRKFIEESVFVDEKCRNCSVLNLCRGGCRRERAVSDGGPLAQNLYCEGRNKFFEYVIKKLNTR